MRKKVSKLALNKETLRHLVDPHLSRVAVGNPAPSLGSRCLDCSSPEQCGTSFFLTGCESSACYTQNVGGTAGTC
jgi:hypothetical protein